MEYHPEVELNWRYRHEDNDSRWKHEISAGVRFFDCLKSFGGNWDELKSDLLKWKQHVSMGPAAMLRTEQARHAFKLYFVARRTLDDSSSNSLSRDGTAVKGEAVLKARQELVDLGVPDTDPKEILALADLFLSKIGDRVEVPFVLANENIHTLELQCYKGYGGVFRDPRKFPGARPSREVGPDFVYAIRAALDWNRRFWELDDKEKEKWAEVHGDDTSKDSLGIIWDIQHDGSEDAESIKGESAGGAAVSGIQRAFLNRFYDKKVLYSVVVEKDLIDGDAPDDPIVKATGKFNKVDGIPQKLKAAVRFGIDTFVTHSTNFNEMLKMPAGDRRMGSRLRIREVDSNGELSRSEYLYVA